MKRNYTKQEFEEKRMSKLFQRKTSKLYINKEREILNPTERKKKTRGFEESF